MLRRAITATVIAAATTAAVLVPAAPAQARACIIQHECYTTWYSDSSRTVVVGEKYEGCYGTISMWGVRSPYVTFTEIPC
jgi:hypothetical protein